MSTSIAPTPTNTSATTGKEKEKATPKVYPVTKERIESFDCMGVPHKGPYHEIGNAFQKLFGLLAGPSPETGGKEACAGAQHAHGDSLGLYLDDPKDTPVEKLHSYAAVKVHANDSKKEWSKEMEPIHVVGGTAAVLTLVGSYDQLASAWESFGPRIVENGWKCRTKDCISCEIYEQMDMKDPSKNITKLIMFIEDDE